MMQQPLPLLVARRLAESFLVRVDAIPPYEEQVETRVLEALLQLVGTIPGHRSDDGLGLAERVLEGSFLPRPHLERGTFLVTLVPTALAVNPLDAKQLNAEWAGTATSLLNGNVTDNLVKAAVDEMFAQSPYLVAGP